MTASMAGRRCTWVSDRRDLKRRCGELEQIRRAVLLGGPRTEQVNGAGDMGQGQRRDEGRRGRGGGAMEALFPARARKPGAERELARKGREGRRDRGAGGGGREGG